MVAPGHPQLDSAGHLGSPGVTTVGGPHCSSGHPTSDGLMQTVTGHSLHTSNFTLKHRSRMSKSHNSETPGGLKLLMEGQPLSQRQRPASTTAELQKFNSASQPRVTGTARVHLCALALSPTPEQVTTREPGATLKSMPAPMGFRDNDLHGSVSTTGQAGSWNSHVPRLQLLS